MFPSSKLFGLCPDWSTCRVFHCPFSHQPQPSTSSAAAAAPPRSALPTSSTGAAPPTSGLPQKRPAAATSINAAPPKRLEQARLAREQGPAQGSSREQALAFNANTAASASQATPKAAAPSAAANVRARSRLQSHSGNLQAHRSLARGNVQSGPPRLVPPRSLSHTPAVTRQKMINALYTQSVVVRVSLFVSSAGLTLPTTGFSKSTLRASCRPRCGRHSPRSTP